MLTNDLNTALQAIILTAVSDAVRPAVAEALIDALPEVIRRAALPPYLSRKQVLELTGWSDRHLSYLQSTGRLPFSKRGRTVRFLTKDIEQHICEAYVPAKKAVTRGQDSQ